MDRYDLVDGNYYTTSTFEDTDKGYSIPRPSKILRHEDREAHMNYGSTFRMYLVEDIDGAVEWLTERDFVSRLGGDYVDRMKAFWGCSENKEKNNVNS